MLIVCSSAASEFTIYNNQIEEFISNVLESEDCMGKRLLNTFLNWESKLWLDGCKYFDCNAARVIPGFLQFVELSHIDECEKFGSTLISKVNEKKIGSSPLLILWIVSTLQDSDYHSIRLIENLFDQNYILLSSDILTNFVNWFHKLKSESNKGLRDLRILYTNYLCKFQNFTRDSSAVAVDQLLALSKYAIDDKSYDKAIDECSSETDVLPNCDLEYGEFYLELDEWHNVNSPDSAGSLRLNRNWTNLFAKKLSELNPKCVLKFKNYWIKKDNSRKSHSPYFQGWAVCKFTNCLSFHFSIEKKIDPKEIDTVAVQFKCEGTFSLEHFDGSTTHSRNLSGIEREKMGNVLVQSPINTIFYKQFNSTNNKGLPHGNLQSQACLRRV